MGEDDLAVTFLPAGQGGLVVGSERAELFDGFEESFHAAALGGEVWVACTEDFVGRCTRVGRNGLAAIGTAVGPSFF